MSEFPETLNVGDRVLSSQKDNTGEVVVVDHGNDQCEIVWPVYGRLEYSIGEVISFIRTYGIDHYIPVATTNRSVVSSPYDPYGRKRHEQWIKEHPDMVVRS